MPSYERHGVERVRAIATSAVRDAANRDMFLAELRERFALDAEILDGAEEARLTYLGAYAERPPAEKTLVVDIGGGSTELVVGDGPEVGFYGLAAGGHRPPHRAPPRPRPARGRRARRARRRRPRADRRRARGRRRFARANYGIAVAGTPTSLAAIDQELDPYDPELVHGYRLSLESIQRMLSLLASMPLEERVQIVGLHPGRAPTIVAGVVILIQVMRAFGLSEIEVSEHDIL